MGFFSNIKNRARGMANDLAPSNMPMAPRRVPPPPMDLDRIMRGPGLNPRNKFDGVFIDYIPGRRPKKPRTFEELLANAPSIKKVEKRGGLGGLFRKLQEQIKNQSDMGMPANPEGRMYAGGSPGLYAPGGRFNRGDRDRIMPNFGMEQMPQQNLDFLSRLPQNMMPQVDFSNLPQLPENFKFNPQMGQMTPGYAVGGPLMGRAANISRQVLSRNAGRNLPDRAMPGIGDRIFDSVYNPKGSLFSAGQQANRIKNTKNAIIAGGAGGAALLADGTQMFREPFSKENTRSFMSPEAFGKDMAQMRMDVGAVINFARNKANEIGADINEYVSRAKQSYEQEMENQRMQELDAEQGMQPFSALLGPDMPLRRPELTEGRTTSDIDDILSSLEKKN
jgi:hypothetical protein